MNRQIAQIVVATIVACGLRANASAESKAHRWLHQHGTVLLAGATHDLSRSDFDVETYLAVGYNALWDANPSKMLFDLADEHRIPWFCNGVKGRIESPNAGGFIVYDEPHFRKVSSLDGSERVYRPYLSGLPGPLGLGIGGPRHKELRFLNLMGMDSYPQGGIKPKALWGDDTNPDYTYSQYVQDVLNIWQPDVLMHDHYPFGETRSPLRYYFSNNFYEHMEIIRRAALARNIPYWRYNQAYGKINDRAQPSRSQARLELFAGLTYGFTGFVHYWYDQPHDRDRGLVCMFFDANADATDFHGDVSDAVQEVSHLGRAVIHLLSTGIRYVSSDRTTEVPRGALSWDNPGQLLSNLDPYQKRITVTGQHDGDDFIIGFFMDPAGERYFMPVNVRHDPESTADCSETVRIEFDFSDSGINRLLRLNRRTGRVEPIEAPGPLMKVGLNGRHQLTLTLPGGTGDLFKYDTGARFVGDSTSLD
jgi:hypothetical protein